jgi:hypothetical protein
MTTRVSPRGAEFFGAKARRGIHDRREEESMGKGWRVIIKSAGFADYFFIATGTRVRRGYRQ